YLIRTCCAMTYAIFNSFSKTTATTVIYPLSLHDALPARTAGLQLDHTEAVEVSRQVDDGASLEDVLLPHMNRWHDGCDCKVVPVFDENWSGRDQWLAAEALWKRVTKGIDRDKINAFR